MPGTPGKKQPSRNGSPWALGLPHTPATRLARGGRGSERRPARECAPAQLVPRVGQACAGLDPGLGAPRTRPPRYPHGSQGQAPPSAPFHGRGNRDPEAEPPPPGHTAPPMAPWDVSPLLGYQSHIRPALVLGGRSSWPDVPRASGEMRPLRAGPCVPRTSACVSFSARAGPRPAVEKGPGCPL